MASETPTKLHSQLLNEDATLIDIVEEFVNGLDGRIQEMKAAFASNDCASLATLAHRLKGAGGSYGYPELTVAGGEMERRFKAQDLSDFDQWIGKLSQLTAAAKAGLPAG